MLTIDSLRQFGANIDEGLGRCMNNEAFYLRMVNMVLDDKGYEKLSSAIRSGDKKAAFEAAHALKGSLGNLALSPIYIPVSQLTELLRTGQDTDYTALLDQILKQREALLAIRAS